MEALAQEQLVEVGLVEAPKRAPVGEKKTFRPYDPNQVLLLSPVLSEWVPEGDLAHFVSDLIETGTLDLRALYQSYEQDRGFPPYDPRLMIKLLLYGYANGVMSSRKLERATYRDVAVRMLVRRPAPRLSLHRSLSPAPPGDARGALRPDVKALPAGPVGRAGDLGPGRHPAARQRLAS
jgi:hypothetical protein